MNFPDDPNIALRSAIGQCASDLLWGNDENGYPVCVPFSLFSAGEPAALPYIRCIDKKAYNEDGGGSSSGINTRALTDIVEDTDSLASLASNQITLPAGIWRVRASSPAYFAHTHFLIIYDATNSVELLYGPTAKSKNTLEVQSAAHCEGLFELSIASAIEVRHYITSGRATDGLGVKTGVSGYDSIFTQAEFWKRA